jgi:hypothetical protein
MDCVDVNVQPRSPGKAGFTAAGEIVNRYGAMPTGAAPKKSVAVKIDHCEFTYVGSAVTQCRVANRVTKDASVCVSECQKASSCSSVQVVRWKNPTNALSQVVSIPFNVSSHTYVRWTARTARCSGCAR